MEPGPDDPLHTARSLLAQLGEPYARCTRGRDGREHHLFRVHLRDGERMLKFPRPDAMEDPYPPPRTPQERLGAEAYALSLAKGVTVPDPYVYYDTEPRCAVMGIVPGTTAEIAYERGHLEEDSLLGVCLQMGKTLAHLHSRKRPDGPDYLPDLAESDPATARLLHMDFHLGNVIGLPRLAGAWTITGVVDWTRARWGPPEADFVEMQVSVFALNPRARDAMIAGYRQVSGRVVDTADVERRAVQAIKRRLATEPPEDPVLRRRWQDWVDRRGG